MDAPGPVRSEPITVMEPGSLTRAGLRRVLGVLCVTEIVSWGVLFYAFPVLAPSMAAALAAVAAALAAGSATRSMSKAAPRHRSRCPLLRSRSK